MFIFISCCLFADQKEEFDQELGKLYKKECTQQAYQQYCDNLKKSHEVYGKVYEEQQSFFVDKMLEIRNLILNWENIDQLEESEITLPENPTDNETIRLVFHFLGTYKNKEGSDYEMLRFADFEYKLKYKLTFQLLKKYKELDRKALYEELYNEQFTKMKSILACSEDPFLRETIAEQFNPYQSLIEYMSQSLLSSPRLDLLDMKKVEPINDLERRFVVFSEEIREHAKSMRVKKKEIREKAKIKQE